MRRRFSARSKGPPQELEAFLHSVEVLANFMESEDLGHRANLRESAPKLKLGE